MENADDLKCQDKKIKLTKEWNVRFDFENIHKHKDSVQRFSEQKKLRNNFHLLTKFQHLRHCYNFSERGTMGFRWQCDGLGKRKQR